jgi:hypothetical protein
MQRAWHGARTHGSPARRRGRSMCGCRVPVSKLLACRVEMDAKSWFVLPALGAGWWPLPFPWGRGVWRWTFASNMGRAAAGRLLVTQGHE